MNRDWEEIPRQRSDYSFLRKYASDLFFASTDSDFLSEVDVPEDSLDIASIEIPESANSEAIELVAHHVHTLLEDVSFPTRKQYGNKVSSEDTTRDLLE